MIMEILEDPIVLVQFKNGRLRKINSHYTIKNDIIILRMKSMKKQPNVKKKRKKPKKL